MATTLGIAAEPTEEFLDDLVTLLRGRRAVALVGAGCSTESGIPDYRGPEGRLRTRKPMQYKEFVGSSVGRARYWSRSAVGWPVFSSAKPNPAHHALAELEHGGALAGVITQNVDGLHQAAGSREVVELHGSLARVRCLDCDATLRRVDFQASLVSMNGDWFDALQATGRTDVESAPDGDADLHSGRLESFRVPGCAECDGVLKPDVVFFGESVPKDLVDEAYSLIDRSEALLVAGSSLTVFSGYRFVRHAAALGIPIAIVNRGGTRGDDLATVQIDGGCSELLVLLSEELVPIAEYS